MAGSESVRHLEELLNQENMQPLAHCIYSSIATPLFREDGVEALLARARAANAEADITGMLLYVETRVEYQWFLEADVRYFQGYLFAKPGFECLPSVRYW